MGAALAREAAFYSGRLSKFPREVVQSFVKALLTLRVGCPNRDFRLIDYRVAIILND